MLSTIQSTFEYEFINMNKFYPLYFLFSFSQYMITPIFLKIV